MTGYNALHDAAAWLDLSGLGRFRLRGEDRLSFLHAICSQKMEGLSPGAGDRVFFLNAQGRIQADAYLFVADDHVLAVTEPRRAKALRAHLDAFIIMDDVVLEDDEGTLLAVEGPDADAIVRRLCDAVPVAPHTHILRDGVRYLRSSWTGQSGIWIAAPLSEKEMIVQRLEAAGAAAATEADGDRLQVENQQPRWGFDFDDANLPHETQRLERVSFSKGCYLGQEIVERVRSRGQVNRLLVGVEVEGAEPPTDATVRAQGREAGQASRLLFSPRLGKTVGFALLRREAAIAGTVIEVGGRPGRVRELHAAESAAGTSRSG